MWMGAVISISLIMVVRQMSMAMLCWVSDKFPEKLVGSMELVQAIGGKPHFP